MTHREIETTLGISGTSIYSVLHEHLTVKKICSPWIPQNLPIGHKKACVDWSKEMHRKYDRDDSKHVYDIVTSAESWLYGYATRMPPKKSFNQSDKSASTIGSNACKGA